MLIVFEGIDGSGKTSQLKRLASTLREKGYQVVESHEPTNQPKGRKARESARSGRFSIEEEYALFVEDRKEHVENLIKPALERGELVLLDRYYFSTMAYQGSRGLDIKKIREENESFAPRPDLLLVFDLPVETAMQRIQVRDGERNAFEQKKGLEFCRNVFNQIEEDWTYKIDADDDAERIYQDIVNKVTQKITQNEKKSKFTS